MTVTGLATDSFQIGFYASYGMESVLRFPSANLILGDAPTESVPEPGTCILCGVALAALGLHRPASVK